MTVDKQIHPSWNSLANQDQEQLTIRLAQTIHQNSSAPAMKHKSNKSHYFFKESNKTDNIYYYHRHLHQCVWIEVKNQTFSYIGSVTLLFLSLKMVALYSFRILVHGQNYPHTQQQPRRSTSILTRVSASRKTHLSYCVRRQQWSFVNVIPSSGRSSRARFASSCESRTFTSWMRVKIDDSWFLWARNMKILPSTSSTNLCKKASIFTKIYLKGNIFKMAVIRRKIIIIFQKKIVQTK